MRLANKITLAYVSLATAVLLANGVVRIDREHALFESEARRDHQLLARSVGSAVQRTWEREGPDAARALIARGDADVASVKLRWVWLDVAPDHVSAPGTRHPVPAQENVPVSFVDAADERHAIPVLRTYLPLEVKGRMGALEIAESMLNREAYIRTSIRNTLIGTAALALLFGLVAIWMARWLLGAPLAQLTELSRRIGAGELEARTELARSDEIGDLARQMNEMGMSLTSARERLQQETRQRVEALDQLRHADRLSTVGKLASGVAHELGTPLNVILGRANMIASGELKQEEARDSASIIGAQVRSMSAIIRSLLDFARPRPPLRELHELSTIAEHVINLLRPLSEKRSVALEFEKPPSAVQARVDAGQLQQVLTNLVMNAVHASPRGSRVTLALANEEARHPDHPEAPLRSHARIDVVDQGAGIAPELLERIFEPFYTTKGVGEGTGLGLSVSWGLVHEHGGWISVESQLGQGSRFTVRLPREATA